MPLPTLSERSAACGENRGAQSPRLVPSPLLLTAGAPRHLEISPCLDSNSSTKQREANYSVSSFHYIRYQRVGWAEVFRPYHRESSMQANTNWDTISRSQTSFLTFLLLEGLPLYLPYLYSVLLYNNLTQDQNRRSNSFISLVNSNATWNLVSVDDSPVAAAEQGVDPYDLCSALQHHSITAQSLTHIMNHPCSSPPQHFYTSSLLSSLSSAAHIEFYHLKEYTHNHSQVHVTLLTVRNS